MNTHSRPSIAPSLATVASVNEEEEEKEAGDERVQENKEQEVVQNINDKEENAVQENKKILIGKWSIYICIYTKLNFSR